MPGPTCPDPYVVISADVMIADTSAAARQLVLPEAWAMVESRTTGAFPPLRSRPAMALTDRQQAKVDEHRTLLELARAGDADRYLAAARRHLQRSRPTLLDTIARRDA